MFTKTLSMSPRSPFLQISPKYIRDFLNEPLPAYDMVQGSLADDYSIEDSLSYLEPEE